jgi:hypothetical protein
MPKIYGNTEILGGDLTVLGNMVISGTQTSLNVEELYVADNIITLNATFSGAPVLDSGIEINRGSSTNSRLIWNETNDIWVAGLSGSESAIITQSGDGLIKSNNQLSVDFGTVSSIAYTDSKNGIYSGSGTIPTSTVATLTNSLTFGSNLLFLDGTNSGIGIGTNNTSSGIMATINTNSSSKYLGLNVDANSYIGSFNYGIISNAQSSNATTNIGVEARVSNATNESIGFNAQITGTSAIKTGLVASIQGNGLSSTNTGVYVNVSGANSQQYGYQASVTGTYSTTNYGFYGNISLGSSNAYGLYLNLSGAGTGTYYGSYVNVNTNTGTSSTNNVASYVRNSGLGQFNTGLVSYCANGNFSNIGVWGISGNSPTYTVGDIGVCGMVSTTATLTSYPSIAGLFYNYSKSTSQNYGLSVVCNGTYSSSNIGLSINVNGSANNIAIETSNGDSIFNSSGSDWDFQINGLTQSNLFFVDADQDRVGIATNTPGADFEVNGFTKLGSDAPAIKTKLIEVTTPASGLSAQNTAHGITGTIIGYTIVCEANDNKLIKPFDSVTAASNYTAYVTTTLCSRSSDYTTNSNIANSPLRFYITYI